MTNIDMVSFHTDPIDSALKYNSSEGAVYYYNRAFLKCSLDSLLDEVLSRHSRYEEMRDTTAPRICFERRNKKNWDEEIAKWNKKKSESAVLTWKYTMSILRNIGEAQEFTLRTLA